MVVLPADVEGGEEMQKRLKEKMGKPTDTVEKLEKDMQKQKQLTFQLDGFARVTSDTLFNQPRRTYDWR